MNSYKLCKPQMGKEATVMVVRLVDNAFIPFDPANTDYQDFKTEVTDGKAELKDSDGNLMTADEAKAFVATLP